MAGFFPVFFKQYWSAGTEAAVSTFRLGARERHRQPPDRAARAAARRHRRPRRRARAHARVLHGDRRGADRRALLGRAGRLDHGGARLFDRGLRFLRAASSSTMRCSSTWPNPPEYDRVSAYGYSLGYLGGGLLLLLNVAMVTEPARFGLAGRGPRGARRLPDGRRLVAPVHRAALLWVRERVPARAAAARRGARRRLAGVAATLGRVRATGRCCGSCSRTGSTSTASTRSSRWPWTTASRSAFRSRA